MGPTGAILPSDEVVVRVPAGDGMVSQPYAVQVRRTTPHGILVAAGGPGDCVLPLLEGREVEVSVRRGVAGFRFPSRVLRGMRGVAVHLLLSAPEPGTVVPVARRQYFRVPLSLPVSLTSGAQGAEAWHPGTTVNLSGGGCCVEMVCDWEWRGSVRLEFALAGGAACQGAGGAPLLQVRGRVRRQLQAETPSSGAGGRAATVRIAIEFTEPGAVVRKRILRLVAYRQRHMIRRDKEG
ncbi:MAG: PilZ domain-containing protein [Candidatus Latescibacterota bacterium]